jgi:hypothetical protein
MTQLELLKKYNKPFYEIIKLRYITNHHNMRNIIDIMPLREHKKEIKQIQNIHDFNKLLKKYEWYGEINELQTSLIEQKTPMKEIERTIAFRILEMRAEGKRFI